MCSPTVHPTAISDIQKLIIGHKSCSLARLDLKTMSVSCVVEYNYNQTPLLLQKAQKHQVICLVHDPYIICFPCTVDWPKSPRHKNHWSSNCERRRPSNLQLWTMESFPGAKTTYLMLLVVWLVSANGRYLLYVCMLIMNVFLCTYIWMVCMCLFMIVVWPHMISHDHHVLLLQKLGPCLLRATQIRWHCKLESLQKLISLFSTSPKTRRSRSW